MGWEKPNFAPLEEAIKLLDEAVAEASKKDLEKLKQIERIFNLKSQQESNGLEANASSSTGI